jgi:hypothetical protein
MMLWFVDPEIENRAIDLLKLTAVEVRQTSLYLCTEERTFIWDYEDRHIVERVYNDVIKLLQQDRYRAYEK